MIIRELFAALRKQNSYGCLRRLRKKAGFGRNPEKPSLRG
jgi:hypothetical protein